MQISSIQNGFTGLAPLATKALNVYYDSRDTNQDGVVSPAENNAYNVKHPELLGLNQSTTVTSALTSSKGLDFVYYDPKDTNKDGFVSTEEGYVYALNHPGEAAVNPPSSAQAASTASNPYTPQGALAVSGKTGSGLLDVYA